MWQIYKWFSRLVEKTDSVSSRLAKSERKHSLEQGFVEDPGQGLIASNKDPTNHERAPQSSSLTKDTAEKFKDVDLHTKHLTKQLLPDANESPLIAVVDDSHFILESWKMMVRDAEVLTFEKPSLFWQAIQSNPDLIHNLTLVVTDYHFDNDLTTDGVEFAKLIKQLRPDIAVFLSSDHQFLDINGTSIDAQIGKEPRAFCELSLNWLKSS